jgi:arylsulfatase A-like enzyme
MLVCGCDTTEQSASPLRLVDLFHEAAVTGARAPGDPAAPRLEWTFAATASDRGGWRAHGVRELEVRDGRLGGLATSKTPLIHVVLDQLFEKDDLLHSVEIAVRVSEGTELSVRLDSEEEFDPDLGLFPWPLKSPIVPGEDLQRYVLRPSRPTQLSGMRRVVIRPTDVSGATFEIESVRIVGRHEHLASIGSGIGWHGMQDVFQESIVTRAPEAVSFSLQIPPRAWLDLSLATIEDGPVTFRVEARSDGGAPEVFERTLTRPHHWDRVRMPLESLGGRDVTLSLSLSAERDGTLGFWGTTAIRSDVAGSFADRPQGVIVVLADTLRADHVNALGYTRETSPILTLLAEQGALARDCVSQATWTKVSVPTIFTSLYPTTHTVAKFDDRLPTSARTMAEVFRDEGYATLALTSIPFVGQFTNLHQGYEELHESGSLAISSNAKTAREYMDRLLPWLEAHRDAPFFVFLHVADPHSPYVAYTPYDAEWGRPGDAEKLGEYLDQVRPLIEDPLMQRFGMPKRHELQQAGVDPDEYVSYEVDAYDGSIKAMDVEIGRLLERLRELDLADRTLLAFVSDHGTEFLEHDAHFHGHSVYGELNRVPMFFWGPGRVPSGVQLEPTVQTIDLMPTLLEYAGLEVPERAQGRSLAPLIRAASEGREQRWPRPAITEKAYVEGDLPGRSYASLSLISERWKLIHNDPAPEGMSEYELYDHRKDPLNLNDIAAENPGDVTRLAELLDKWRVEAEAARLDESALEQNMSAEELQRLRSLGYLQ